MEKSMSIFKRLLATILVFAMVVGYMPVGVFADDEVVDGDANTTEVSKTLELEVSATPVYSQEDEEPTEDTSGDVTPEEETTTEGEVTTEEEVSTEGEVSTEEEVATEESSEQNVETTAATDGEPAPLSEAAAVASYTYTAAVIVDGEAVPNEEVTYQWKAMDGETEITGEGAEFSTTVASVELTAVYDGITLNTTVNGTDVQTSAEIEPQLESVTIAAYKGVKVADPQITSETVSDDSWTIEWNTAYVVDGVAIDATAEEVDLVTVSLKGDSGTVYLSETVKCKIENPVFTAKITTEDGQEIDSQKVYGPNTKVKVTVTSEPAVVSSEYVATEVKVGEAVHNTWVLKDGKWVQTIALNQSAEVSCLEAKASVQVDVTTPAIQILYAYENNGKLYIELECTYGGSGVKKIEVFKQGEEGLELVHTEENVEFVDETHTTIVIDEIIEPVVKMTNGLGNTCSTETPFTSEPALEIEILGPAAEDILGVDANDKTYAPNAHMTIRVTNAKYEGDAYALDKVNSVITLNGEEYSDAEWSFVDGVWICEVPLNNGLESLKVKVADGKRAAEKEYDGIKYYIDEEPPVVTVSREIDPVNDTEDADYYKDPVTYNFEITDVLLNDVQNSVTYTVNETEKTVVFENGKASFTVENGEKLTGFVVNAEDASGNKTTSIVHNFEEGVTGTSYVCNEVVDTENPKVTVTVSDNVKSFYTDPDGNVYAVLEPVAHIDGSTTGSKETVKLTVKVEDSNLNESCFTAENGNWTVNGDVAIGVFELTTDVHDTNMLSFGFTYKDLANRSGSENLIVVNANGEPLSPGYALTTEVSGSYSSSFRVDRRAPGSEPEAALPTITLTTEAEHKQTADGVDLFNGSFEYNMVVTDNSKNGYDSGVDSVTWSVNNGEFLSTNESGELSADGKYTVSIFAKEGYEANNAILEVVVADAVGNNYTYYKTFAVDTKAPVIENNGDKVENGGRYAEAKEVKINVSDLNLSTVEIKINDSAVDQEEISFNGTTASYTHIFNQDGTYTLTVTGKDVSGNTETVVYGPFVVDLSDPVVTVEKVTTASCNTVNGVDYYDGEVTYNITVEDYFLNLGVEEKAEIKVTAVYEDGTITDVEISEIDSANGVYMGSFTVTDGCVLTGIAIDVTNNVGRHPSAIETESAVTFADEDGDDVWEYNGNQVVVDKTAPEITVEKNGELVQSYNEHDYYDDTVSYTVTVKDAFLGENVTKVTVYYSDGTDAIYELKRTQFGSEKVADEEIYSGSFSVTDGKAVTGIVLNIRDNAGNAANAERKNLTTNDNRTTFGYNSAEKTWKYTGNPVVVDSTAPTAELYFSENVKSFFMNGSTIYVILTNPVKGDSGETPEFAAEKVSVTIKVTDKNLDADNADGVKALKTREKGDWEGDFLANQENTYTLVASGAEVMPDGTYVFRVDVTVEDLAGNKLTSDNLELKTGSDGVTKPIVTVDDNGVVCFDVSVDRLRPSSGKFDESAPVIEVTPSIDPTKTADGKDLFDGSFKFELIVTDGTSNKFNSGVKYVKWTVEDENGVVKSYESDEQVNEDGIYTIAIDTNDELGESNEVTLSIEAMDNVGNVISYTKTFGVDTLAPRISYTYVDENGETVELESGVYFNDPTTITVHIEDLNMDQSLVESGANFITVSDYSTYADTVKVYVPENISKVDSGETSEEVDIVYSYEVPFLIGGSYGLTTNVADLANNEAEEKHETFIVDMTDPVISIQKEVEEGKGLINTLDGVDYYDGVVTYHVEISDENIDGFAASAVLYYSFEDGTEVLLDSFEHWNQKTVDGKTVYSHDIEVGDQKVLTGISVQATDNAGNAAKIIDCTDENTVFAYLDSFGNTHVYSGTVVVDKQAPAINVTKKIEEGGKFVQEFEEHDYYDAPVTYTVTVIDSFLNAGAGVAEVTVSYLDGSETTLYLTEGDTTAEEDDAADDSKLVADEKYTGRFTVEDGMVVTGIALNIQDNSGNTANEDETNLVVVDANNVAAENEEADIRTAFEHTNGIWKYTGNPVVVDTYAPEAVITFSNNVESYYQKDGTVYVILQKPVEGESGEESTQENETVTVTITVTDKNLSLNYGLANNLKDDETKWVGETAVNTDSTVEFKKEITVAADGTGYIALDITAFDLADNPVEEITCDTEAADGTCFKMSAYKTETDVVEGRFANVISLDRRRATSEGEEGIPTIVVESPEVTHMLDDDKELFNYAPTFDVTVNDGVESDKNSGLASIEWSITGPDGYIVDTGASIDCKGEYSAEFHPYVELANQDGESNDVVLTITVTDKVGNVVTYQKTFGVDTWAPRVEIIQDNTSVRNDKYFKDDQGITVVIEDLNFCHETSTVTTEVDFSGWTPVAGKENTYSTKLIYNVDGDYTFAMESIDLAENEAEIDYETGLVALTEFTIDKTAPIITVTYDPAVPVDTDPNGVQYFDKARTVTVTIHEHNFSNETYGPYVTSNLGAKNALSPFYGTGDIRTATETFEEGNGYSVHVTFTDLAGNEAVPYTSPKFSVDTHKPSIEMTKGSVKNGQPISDELLLGYTINDAQENLKEFTVEVVFLDRTFQQKKVECYTITPSDGVNGYVDFDTIEALKENDGIYTVRITAVDYAGNTETLPSDLFFSLNRFGSTFYVDDPATSEFLTVGDTGIVYHKGVEKDLVIKEINPDQVWQDASGSKEGSAITVSVNGESIVLTEGTDYDMEVVQKGTGNDKWYEYTYTIKTSVFSKNDEPVDGDYSIYFYSEDDAANKNTNESNEGSELVMGADGTYSGKISFTLDHKAPIVTIIGVEAGESYVEEYRTVEINVSDNTPFSIEVYVNDVLVEVVDTTAGKELSSDWIYYDASTGSYMLNLSQKDDRQSLRVVVVDAAGNELVSNVDEIMLTKDLVAQYVNSPVAIITSIVIGLGLIILIILLLKKRKEKDDNGNA